MEVEETSETLQAGLDCGGKENSAAVALDGLRVVLLKQTSGASFDLCVKIKLSECFPKVNTTQLFCSLSASHLSGFLQIVLKHVLWLSHDVRVYLGGLPLCVSPVFGVYFFFLFV